MEGSSGRGSFQQYDPFAPESQRFQPAETTRIPVALGEQHSPSIVSLQQSYRASRDSIEAPYSFNSPSNAIALQQLPQPSYQGVTSPLPSFPSAPSPPRCLMPRLECKKSLGDYFAIEDEPRTIYTDQECAEIARLLKETDREPWSRVPRIYTILRMIEQLQAIDGFLDLGMNDLWLPFHITQLPKSMSTFYRERFIEAQSMVLTKAVDLENGNLKKHTHFRQGEAFPFDIGDKLGEGGYASVDKVYSSFSGRTYARKRFRRTKGSRPSEIQSFMTELQVLKRINHQHCVELVASYTDSKYFGLLISPVADFNLSEFYSAVVNNEGNQKVLRTFFGCLMNALHFLHHSKIRHRDIKPANILVKGSTVYLADFGISLDWENLSRSTTTEDSAKSYIYCAPEVANYEKRNSSSDIWSLGCVFLEMLTVLKGLTVHDLRALFRQRTERTRFYENFDVAMDWLEQLHGQGNISDNDAARWVREMMVVDPTKRSSAQSLSLSIATFRNKNREEVNPFCGECCSHDIESSSEAASDGEAWAGGFNEHVTTPTPGPRTDDSQKLTGPRQSLKPVITSNFRNLQLSNLNMGELNHIKYNHDRELQEVADAEGVAKLNSKKRVAVTMKKDALTENNQESIGVREEVLPSAVEMIQQSQERTQAESEPQIAKPLLEQKITHRRQLLEDLVIQPWPFADFQGRLPALNGASWRTPSAFLESVKSDVLFMEYLRLSHPSRFDQFNQAGLDDLAPMIHLLLLNGMDVNNKIYRDTSNTDSLHKGATPLHFTLDSNWRPSRYQSHINELLIGFGAQIDEKTENGQCTLTRASSSGSISTLKVLLDLGCRLDEYDKDGYSTLCYASLYGQAEVVSFLLDNGASISAYEDKNPLSYNTPLVLAALGGYLDVIKVLLGRGTQLSTGGNCFALMASVKEGRQEIVRYLLDNGYYDTAIDDREKYLEDKGYTALHMAAERGHLQIVEWLLDKGANCHLTTPRRYTPLHLAALYGHHLVVELLIKRGASFRTASKDTTPSTSAAASGHLKVIQTLVENGLDADEGYSTLMVDWRPIHQACRQGHVEMVKYLLVQGADPTRRLGRAIGSTPLSLAKQRGHKEVMKILEEAIKDWKGRYKG